jgi:assimilatory nitrate reductase catalytic subunit
MHWTDQFASNARIDTLVPAVTDPHSGQPASKRVPARIERFAAAKYGFAVLCKRPHALASDYWALAKCEGGWRLELAFGEDVCDLPAIADLLFNAGPTSERLAYHDATADRYRFACFDGDRLLGALFLAKEPVVVSRDWACRQLTAQHSDHRTRMAVVAGRPGLGHTDRGAIICSCFGIGAIQIEKAVAEGCLSVEAISRALNAGSNCGSCRGEISRILNQSRVQTVSLDADSVGAG